MKPDEMRGKMPDEMREFLMVLRRALLLIVRWIEKKYKLE